MTESARFASSVRDGSVAADLVVTGIGQLCTVHHPELDDKEGAGPRRRAGMEELGLFENAALAVGAGRILACGPEQEGLSALYHGDKIPAGVEVVDAGGRAVIPGLLIPIPTSCSAGPARMNTNGAFGVRPTWRSPLPAVESTRRLRISGSVRKTSWLNWPRCGFVKCWNGGQPPSRSRADTG